MPRISDEILNCSVFLYRTEAAAQAGEAAGGSGFLVSVPSVLHPGKAGHIYVVTNRHVIEDNKVIRINSAEGNPPIIRELSNWHIHPSGDDIAVHNLTSLQPPLTRPFNLRHVSIEMFATETGIAQLNMGIGDEVFMVGRLIGRDGKEQNAPTVRFGHVAAPLAALPIHMDYGSYDFDQESFLVECRALPGYSGSPLFIDVSDRQRRQYQKELQGYSHFLLGVICASHPYDSNIVAGGHEVPDLWVNVDSGITTVIPAGKIKEILNTKILQQDREIEEKQQRSKIVLL